MNMSIQIKEIKEKKEWDDFVESFSPDTFLQSWEWGKSQEVLGNKIFYLGIFEGEKLEGAAFVYKVNARRGSFLFCPHGPLMDWSEEDLFKKLIDYLKILGRKEKVDFVRISPMTPREKAIANLFKKAKFINAPIHMMHPELAWILDLNISEEELLKNMAKRHRYSIKKAQKEGIKIESSTDFQDVDKFYDIYKETAKRQGFIPFSKEYVKKEFEIFTKENKAKIFFAYYKGEIIAGAVIIFSNHSGFYHHGASNRKYPNIPASELLQWEAILECKKRNLKKYNFWGVVPDSDKNHSWIGLSHFKRGFGGYEKEYFHAQDFPITYKYWFNYLIEKVRKIKKGY